MLTTILDSNEHWQPVVSRLPPDTFLSAFNNTAVLPGGNQYILQSGTISYKANGKTIILDKDAMLGSALAISPDKLQLVASGKHSHWLYDYIIHPDGTLADKQTLYWLHDPGNNDTSEVQSLAFDTNGNLYVATDIGVQVCDQNGRVRAILSLPGGPVSELWFDPANLNILFVKCGGKLYKRKLKVTGAPPSQKAITPLSQGAG